MARWQDGSKGFEVKDFLLRQPEVDEFEWDSQKVRKEHYTPGSEL